MLKIRLQRIGRRNEPHFRMIVTDVRRGPKSANFIEILGSYNPKLGNVSINTERAKHWLSVGAQTSDTVYNFLVSQGVIDGRKKNALPTKSPVIDEEALKREAEAKAKAEAEAKAKADAEAKAAEEAAAAAAAPAVEEEVAPEAAPVAEEVAAEETPAE